MIRVSYKNIWNFAVHYWRRRLKSGLAAVFLMLAAVISDMILPIYVGKTVDVLAQGNVGDAGSLDEAVRYFMIFVGLGVAFSFLRSASIFFWNWFAVYNLYDIVNEGMRKVQRFSADWHANAFAGGTVRKVTRGMWSFDVFEDTLFMGLFPAVCMMVGMAVMLITQVPDVGYFAAATIVFYAAFSIWVSVKILAPRFRESAAADTKLGATLADIITGNPTVKAFGAERREDDFFKKIADHWLKKAMVSWQLAQATDLIRSLLRMVMMAGMFGLTIWMWTEGRATAGDTALVLTSFFIVGGYLRDIGMHITNLQKSASELEDIVYFWMRQDEIQDVPGAKTLVIGQGGRGPGEIEFKNVNFGYESQKKPVFEDFSIHIRAGEKIALVGPSGSGKSTFAKLLQRLYDIQSGEILIDGQNIAHVTQESLRQALALVPQDPILFHRSLTDNIKYGRPHADQKQVEQAAAEAFAHDFIQTLPFEYNTLVGERGIKLSGGERQRVAIARAILADAKILILDEATSSLDSISEHYIQKALESLMRGRTTITIAHRLATIRQADRILVFDKGRVVEEGTHDALLKRADSHYKKLFDMQALDLVG
ncbi:MAG: ABC transporter ATP-binding protein [Micavibrio sp.]